MKVIQQIGSFFYKTLPGSQSLIRSAYIRFFSKLNFIGWGMATEHQVPWNDEYNWKSFREACIDVKQNFQLSPSSPSSPVNIDDLKWRHWVVSYAVRKAIKFARAESYNFVECGVGDGLTAFFALREIRENGIMNKSTFHLYDAWQAMEKKRLENAEQSLSGQYHSLSLERTHSNLQEFKEHIVYHVGYIPETLSVNAPASISFLHIDLNSSRATLAALEFFLPRLVHNGVILLDDYGFFNFNETKQLVDKFFSNKPGVLEKLATGQAIYHHIDA